MNNFIFCFILFFIVCIFIIYTFNLQQYFFKLKVNRKSLICIGVLFVSVFSILTVTAGENEKSTQVKKMSFLDDNSNGMIQDISLNKVVIVGDSRMELITSKEDELDIPNNFIFDALSGARRKWLIDSGRPKLEKILDNKDNNYTYHVVFNLGVNDLNSSDNPKTLADKYFDIYKEIIFEYSDVYFYFLSVNPIDEDVIEEKFSPNERTNDKIEVFNARMYENMVDLNNKRVNYCDAYNRLKFGLPDGLHYDDETDQRIVDFIARDCINFK